MQKRWTILILSKEKARILRLRVVPLAIVLVLLSFLGMTAFSFFAGYKLYSQGLELTRMSRMEKQATCQNLIIADLSHKIASLVMNESNPLPGSRPAAGGTGIIGTIGQADLTMSGLIERHLSSPLHHEGKDVSLEYEAARELLSELERQRAIIAHTPSLCPARGLVSSRYGWRDSPFTGEREFHKGLDIASAVSSPVYAPAEGVVTSYGRCGSIGNAMVISHGYGVTTRYGHLKKPAVKIGQHVKKGDKIAYLGDSGRSTGSHLHYEVLVNGLNVNPQRYVLK